MLNEGGEGSLTEACRCGAARPDGESILRTLKMWSPDLDQALAHGIRGRDRV